VEEGRRLEAVAVVYSAWGGDPMLASELLRIVEQEVGGLDGLDSLARTLYKEADFIARRALREGLGSGE